MAHSTIPHFQNDMGLASIDVGSHRFMCMGAKPPFDHPHVFLTFGAGHDTVCPYCSTHYRLDETLGEGQSTPVEARFTFAAA